MTSRPRGSLAAALLGFTLAAAGCAGTPTPMITDDFIDDSTIATTLMAKLVGDPVVKAVDIQVETSNNGRVQLSGYALSQEQIDRAVTIAANTHGVKLVRNDLRLR